MKEQKSFNRKEGGVLYLVPTPIGNLEDMTFRAIRTLKEVDLIAAEDTRNTIKLLNHYEIESSLVSYHEHNKRKAGTSLMEKMKEGISIALVSDAGMPAISDPGADLAREAISVGIPVISLPGANAALTSLVASGLPTEEFHFVGFLPRQTKERKVKLESLKNVEATLLFYESPHRLKETLHAMYKVLGNREVTICRELTKKFEEYQRGSLEQAIQWSEQGTIKGEFCIVIEGGMAEEEDDAWWNALSNVQHVEHYIELGMSSKEAIKQVAKERGVQKREVYGEYHQKG